MSAHSDKPAAGPGHRRRDSSLYRKPATDRDPEEVGFATSPGGKERNRFLVNTGEAEGVSVEHQAVIDELTSTLTRIEQQRTTLELQLNDNHTANKLEIAQVKGRLAELRRKATEIEDLLRARAEEPADSPADD